MTLNRLELFAFKTIKQSKPLQNSILKKKLSLLTKLKNLTNMYCLEEFTNEDMSNFLSEIITTILNINIRNEDDLFKILKAIIYFNNVYDDFFNIFKTILQRLIIENMKASCYIYVVISFECMCLNILEFNLDKLGKLIVKMNNEESVKICVYLSEFYSDLFSMKEIIDDSEVNFKNLENDKKNNERIYSINNANYDFDSENEIKNMNHDSNIEIKSENYCEKNQDNTNDEIDTNYDKINCKKEPNEHNKKLGSNDKKFVKNIDLLNKNKIFFENFTDIKLDNIKNTVLSIIKNDNIYYDNFYEEYRKIFDNLNEKIPIDKKNFVKVIEIDKNEFAFYDLECFNNDNFEFNEKRIIKDIKNFRDINIIAKNIAKNKTYTDKFIFLLENKTEECFIIFLCELSKFNKFSKKKILKLIDNFYKDKNFEMIFKILQNVARFYLNDEETNFGMRLFLQKLKNYKNECNETVRIEINNCFSRILSRKKDDFYINEFLSYFFTEQNFDFDSDFIKILSKNDLIMFFMKPWIFEDLNFIYDCINKFEIYNEMRKSVFEAIQICIIDENKNKCISYVKFYALMIKNDHAKCKKFYERFLKMKCKNYLQILSVFLANITDANEFIEELGMVVEINGDDDDRIYFENIFGRNTCENNISV